MFGGALSQHLAGFIETPSARVIAGCCNPIFIVTLLVGALVNFLIGELIRVTGLSSTDRFSAWFSAPRGGFAGGRAGRLISLAQFSKDSWWQQSHSAIF